MQELTNLALASSKTTLSASDMRSPLCLIRCDKGMGGIQGELVSRAGNSDSSWGSVLLVHVIVSLKVVNKRRE